MKYLYYYTWLIVAKFGYIITKPLYQLRMKIRKTPLEFKKLDDIEIKNRKKDWNVNNYAFPDGVTHWHAFGLTYLLLMIILFLLPLFIKLHFFTEYIVNTMFKTIIYLLSFLAILWYLIYIKKSNKEWLKKKINKKSKEFYL